MSIVELRPHLYRLLLGRYQAYLWRDDESVTLIDTGEAGSGPEWLGWPPARRSRCPPPVLAYLTRPRECGVSERTVGIE